MYGTLFSYERNTNMMSTTDQTHNIEWSTILSGGRIIWSPFSNVFGTHSWSMGHKK